jgi:hypothetical protein
VSRSARSLRGAGRRDPARRGPARALLVGLVALPLAGCFTTPPSIEDDSIIRMENVSLGGSRVYYRDDVAPERAHAVVQDVEPIRLQVGDLLGVAPPRTQLVVWEPGGPPGAAGPLVDRVLCLFLDRDYTIRFRYPLEDDEPLGRAQLLGTVGHEVAEATVLGLVTTLDPYLRWMHDGVAELVEHEVLAQQDREGARLLLQRTLAFVKEQRAGGVEWVDLTRWRQIGDDVVRAQRLLQDGLGPLGLGDLARARARVRQAQALAGADAGDGRRDGLAELGRILDDAETRAGQPWRPGEARTDDAEALDYLFYNAAFAVWLGAERAAPGALQRFAAGLVERRGAGDAVLAAAEAAALFAEAAPGARCPPLDHVPLEWIEGTLAAEVQRLSR